MVNFVKFTYFILIFMILKSRVSFFVITGIPLPSGNSSTMGELD